MQKRTRLKTKLTNKICNILCIALLFATATTIICTANEAQIKFGFVPGFTYDYQLDIQAASRAKAYDSSYNENDQKETIKFKLKTIDFEKGAFIVDITTEKQTFRRYIKENGQISGAPAESGQQVPFTITLPEQSWQVGQKHQVNKTISLGSQSLPTSWSLLLKSIDNNKNLAEIWFINNIKLPQDRLRKKTFSLKGKISFDLDKGIITQANWTSQYNFSMINKEIAVTRPLWDIQQKVSYELKLINVSE
jgi:hypothetical protein